MAEAISSEREVPPFNNSAMDGYAVRWQDIREADVDQPAELSVLEVIQAGAVPDKTVTPGTASKIMDWRCGFRPAQDTVIRVEDTQERDGRVLIHKTNDSGANVRAKGEDIHPGQMILEKGRVLRPADIGLLASVGRSFVLVRQRPRVAILSTGNELVEVDGTLQPGQIVNSNALYPGGGRCRTPAGCRCRSKLPETRWMRPAAH